MQVFYSLLFLLNLLILIMSRPHPDESHHERVRIHVPAKFKTVYKTKFVKVPEHHHHYHEKIKTVPHYVALPHEDKEDEHQFLNEGY